MDQSVVEKTSVRMEAAYQQLSREFSTKIPRTWLENLTINYEGCSVPLAQLTTLSVRAKNEIELRPFDQQVYESVVSTLRNYDVPLVLGQYITIKPSNFVPKFPKSQFAITAVTECRKRMQLIYVESLAEVRDDEESEDRLHNLLETYRKKIDKLENSDDEGGDFESAPVRRPELPPHDGQGSLHLGPEEGV